jgi:hypothetical protein
LFLFDCAHMCHGTIGSSDFKQMETTLFTKESYTTNYYNIEKHLDLMRWTWNIIMRFLTPKGRRPFFGLFLEFGQPIVDAIFVQKISNFWWTCGLVLASRRTKFYKIPIFGSAIMPQKHNYFELWAASGSPKTFYF